MATGTIWDVIQQFSAQLLRQERAAASQMVRVYFTGWKTVRKQFEALQKEYTLAISRGEAVGPNWFYQWERAQSLQQQIATEIDKFSSWSEKLVMAHQKKAITAALEQSEVLTTLDLLPKSDIVGLFNRINPKAVEAMVGINQPGSPLTMLFTQLRLEGIAAAQNALIQGALLGYNPRKTAKLVRDAMGISLDRALTIARTETLRAYRVAATENYKANDGVVKGWKWVAACDPRTCPACFAMHGTEHPADEVMQTHPNCRCVQAPVTYSYAELFAKHGVDPSLGANADAVKIDYAEVARKYGIDPSRIRGFTDGESALNLLTQEQQIEVLGKTRWQAWQEGKLDLSEMVSKTYSAEWGEGIKVTPLRNTFSAAELAEFRNK